MYMSSSHASKGNLPESSACFNLFLSHVHASAILATPGWSEQDRTHMIVSGSKHSVNPFPWVENAAESVCQKNFTISGLCPK